MNNNFLKELLKDLQTLSLKIEKGMNIDEEDMVKIIEKIKKIKELFT